MLVIQRLCWGLVNHLYLYKLRHTYPMKLQLLSDLHLEVDPSFRPQVAPQAQLLVLAGDIGAAANTPMANHGRDDFYLSRFSPKLGNWPTPVIYVPGNHEFDGQDFDEARGELRMLVESLGIIWLEQECVMLDGVRILGTTLWTDFDALSDMPDSMPGAMTHNLRMREKAFRAANFYLSKTGSTRYGMPFDAQAVREEALLCQRWLRDALAIASDAKTLVITHFAPSLKSHDPRYGVTPGTVGFCNALDPLVAQADVWLHGHLHCASNYRIGKCQVIANPLGYYKKGEQSDFLPQCIVTV